MSDRMPNSPEFDDLDARLRERRYQASPLELDRIKQRAIAQASRSTTRGAGTLRTRLVAMLAAVFLLAAGTGGVIAASNSGGSPGSAAASQYKPPPAKCPKGKHHNGRNACVPNKCPKGTHRRHSPANGTCVRNKPKHHKHHKPKHHKPKHHHP